MRHNNGAQYLFNRTRLSPIRINERHILYAGGDWSGTTRDDVFVFALAALPNIEVWYQRSLDIRQQLGIARKVEFHAQGMTEFQLLSVLRCAMQEGLIVGLVTLRRADRNNKINLEMFDHSKIATRLFESFRQRYILKRLWYDEEIKGKESQRLFESNLYRIHRAKDGDESFKSKCRRSHSSDMVQLADVVGYVLRRYEIGALKDPALNKLANELMKNGNNVIVRC